MYLVEKHIIGKSHDLYSEIDSLCFLAKNLYNATTYAIRQEFINTSKEKEQGLRENANWLRYNELQKKFQNENNADYRALPTKVAQLVMMKADKNWCSFFKSIKTWVKNPSSFTGKPSLPRYKHKTKGRSALTYNIQAISKRELKNNIVSLSGTSIKINTRVDVTKIKEVRVVPLLNKTYKIEIVYEKQEKQQVEVSLRIAGGDPGVSNLLTVTSNIDGMKPFIINGRPLKSINQYFNKKKAELQSYIGKGTSNRIEKLTHKRNMKVDDYLHKATRLLTDMFVEQGIDTVVVGKNKGWKTDVNHGTKNNQNFVEIPFASFINMLIYKCSLEGIKVIPREEAHTSKCSFLDNESVEHHDKYMGRRIKRGMFKSSNGTLINADCNGSLNTIKKEFPTAFDGYGIEGVVVHPTRLNPEIELCKRKMMVRVAIL